MAIGQDSLYYFGFSGPILKISLGVLEQKGIRESWDIQWFSKQVIARDATLHSLMVGEAA